MQTWQTVLQPIKNTESFNTLLEKVNARYKQHTVYPPQNEIFKAFELTPFCDVKIVILGQDPYHQVDQANGLAFSVKKGVKIPPSLRNIYKELHHDIGINMPNHGDLSAWAKQGVLLLNTTLTVEDSKPAVHKNLGWQWFTDEVIKTLNNHEYPIVFMLWGTHARAKKKFINTNKHYVLEASHPSPLSARYSFFGCHHFSKANTFLQSKGRSTVDYSVILE